MKRRTLLGVCGIIVIVLVIVSIAWYFLAQPQRTSIKVGHICSLTGAVATAGIRANIVAEAMVNDINSKGGVYVKEYGRSLPIERIPMDDESTPSRGTELASKLILETNIDLLLITSYAHINIPVCKVSEQYGCPVISGTPIDYIVDAGPWNITWCYFFCQEKAADGFVDLLEDYRAKTNNKFGILCLDAITGRVIHGFLPPKLTPRGYTVVNLGLYPADIKDFTTLILTLKNEQCDILWFDGYPPQFATFWRQCAQLGYKPKIMFQTGGLSRPEEVEALGVELGIGILTHIAWTPEFGYPYCDFLRELNEKTIREKGIDLGYEYGYYAALVLIIKDSVERAGTLDKKAIARAIGETDMTGPTGPIKFDKNKHVGTGYMTLGQWVKTPEGLWKLQPVWSEAPTIKREKLIFPLP